MKVREFSNTRRDITGEAVASEVEVRECIEVTDVVKDFSGEVVLGEVEVPEVGAVVHPRRKLAGDGVVGEVKFSEALEVADCGREFLYGDVFVREEKLRDGSTGATDLRPSARRRR